MVCVEVALFSEATTKFIEEFCTSELPTYDSLPCTPT
eukprot:SAG31_NODE_2233_length_6136_cov_2.169455_4_plen_37_part_00